MRNPLFIIGAAVIALLVVAGLGYLISQLDFGAPPPPEPAPQQAEPAAEPPAQLKESKPPAEPPAPSFEEKVESFRQGVADVIATGESKEVTLVFTETEVNQRASKLIAQTVLPEDIPLEIKSTHIDFQADNILTIQVGATTDALGPTIEVNPEVKTKVGIKDGKPDVEVLDISFGNPLLDALLKDKVADLATQKADDLLVRLTEAEIGGNGKVDLEFADIKIQQEKMTVTVIIKPVA